MKVLLSGAGGDEIFGGYPRHFPNKIFSAGWFAALKEPFKRVIIPILGLVNKAYNIRLQTPARNFAANISGVNYALLSEALYSEIAFKIFLRRSTLITAMRSVQTRIH